jgi:hypothetical protein
MISKEKLCHNSSLLQLQLPDFALENQLLNEMFCYIFNLQKNYRKHRSMFRAIIASLKG